MERPLNLNKLALVDWQATVLVAAPALNDFESIRNEYGSRYPHITFGWWPTLPGSYWVSGLASPRDLEHVFSEILSKSHERELPVLIDLELPLNKRLWLKNLKYLFSNKRKLAEFFIQAPAYNLKIYTAEYPAATAFMRWAYRLLGISPSFALPHTKLPMCYSSMIDAKAGRRGLQKIQNFERDFARAHPKRVGFGLGTIATGVQGNEPILSLEGLAADFAWASRSGVEEVFIFRLGGLTTDHLTCIRQTAIRKP
jgi:hypothetical protein